MKRQTTPRVEPEFKRAEYDVPGGLVVFTSHQFPPFIAIRFDGERMGARRTLAEAREMLAQYAEVERV